MAQIDIDKIKIVRNINKNTIKEKLLNKYENSGYDNPVLELIAYPMDEDIARKMKFINIDKLLNFPLEQLIAINFGATIAEGLTVNEKNYPKIYNILKECCETLNIDIPYTVIDSNMTINAGTVGNDTEAYIMLSNMVSKFLTDEQLKFVIGHECGHIAMKHMTFHTAAKLGMILGSAIPYVREIISLFGNYPLSSWERCSEITADRIGLLCCQDLNAAQTALLRIIGGFTDIDNIDVQEYISEAEKTLSKLKLGKLIEYNLNHPLIYKRLKALEYFYNSEIYYQALGLKVPEGKILYSKNEMNKKTKEFLAI